MSRDKSRFRYVGLRSIRHARKYSNCDRVAMGGYLVRKLSEVEILNFQLRIEAISNRGRRVQNP